MINASEMFGGGVGVDAGVEVESGRGEGVKVGVEVGNIAGVAAVPVEVVASSSEVGVAFGDGIAVCAGVSTMAPEVGEADGCQPTSRKADRAASRIIMAVKTRGFISVRGPR